MGSIGFACWKGCYRSVKRSGCLPLRGGQAAAFQLELGGGHRFLLAVSADVWRGFSGEGNQLETLMEEMPAEWIAGANRQFRGNELLNPALFALEHDLAPSVVDRLCASLSAMGLLGFDLAAN